MISRKLESYLDISTPLGATAIGHTFRYLRAAGLLPSAGRGLSSPPLTTLEAANGIVGICAPSPADAPQSVLERMAAEASWSGVTVKGVQPPITKFAGCETFGEALVQIIEDWKNESGVRAVAIYRTWPRAVIEMKEGDDFFYGITGSSTDLRPGYRPYAFAEIVRINISILSQLGLKLQDKDERRAARWGADLPKQPGETIVSR